MNFPATDLAKALTEEYKMEAIVRPLGSDVTFFGTELECYKIAYNMRAMGEAVVCYSEDLKSWACTFPYWFDIDFAARIS